MSTTTTYWLGYVGFLSSFEDICDNIYHFSPSEAILIKGFRKKKSHPLLRRFYYLIILDLFLDPSVRNKNKWGRNKDFSSLRISIVR